MGQAAQDRTMSVFNPFVFFFFASRAGLIGLVLVLILDIYDNRYRKSSPKKHSSIPNRVTFSIASNSLPETNGI